MKRIIILCFLTLFSISSVCFAGDIDSIPEGFCGYSWGTPPDEMPESTFIMYAGGHFAVYQVNNIRDYDYKSLLPENVIPNSVRILFANKDLFQAQIEFDRRYAHNVWQYLTDNYGKYTSVMDNNSNKHRYWIRYSWDNKWTSIQLTLNSTGNSVTMEISDILYTKSAP